MHQLQNSLQVLVVSNYGGDWPLESINVHQMLNLCILLCDGFVMLTFPLPKSICWFRGEVKEGLQDIFLKSSPFLKLVSLNLRYSRIKNLPESFGGSSNLEDLDLGYCGALFMLPDSFGSLKHLKTLNLEFSGFKNLLVIWRVEQLGRLGFGLLWSTLHVTGFFWKPQTLEDIEFGIFWIQEFASHLEG